MKDANDLKMLREFIMRGNYMFPETEEDMSWFEQGFEGEKTSYLFEWLHDILKLGKEELDIYDTVRFKHKVKSSSESQEIKRTKLPKEYIEGLKKIAEEELPELKERLRIDKVKRMGKTTQTYLKTTNMTNGNDSIHNSELGVQYGLTKREYFAAKNVAAMVSSIDSEENYQRLKKIANQYCMTVSQWIARDSVKQADALIAELNK